MNRVLTDVEPIFTVACPEKGGRIIREVRPTRLSFDRLRYLWDRLKEFDVLFNDFTRGEFRAFAEHFIRPVGENDFEASGLMWDVDDVGIFLLNNIVPLDSAEAHFVFWDLRFRGREELCRKMVEYVMEKYSIHRVYVRVPLFAKHTLNAVDRIGFVREGRLRKAILYKDEWFDVNLYSMLAEDFDFEMDGRQRLSTRQLCLECGKGFLREQTDHGTIYFREESHGTAS